MRAARPSSVPAVGVAFGLSTGPDGITEDVVFVGAGADADYVGKDVAGKIVLVSKLPSPNNAVAAAAHGARGMICMSAGNQRHKMIITPVWGTPEFDQAKSIPRVHVVSIAKTDGDPVIEMLKAGPVRATLTADTFEGWRTVRLPTCELAGREPNSSLVGAHYCSWFDGSTDNVTGDSCVLELARILKLSTASCATAFVLPGGRATAMAATRARPGMPTRSGTSCATTRSRISTSTARA